MNPNLILGFVLSIIAAAGAGFASGHHSGVSDQKVIDQAQFDRINQATAERKTQANALYRQKQDANLALMVERDQLKTRLEKQYAINTATTTALRDKYFGVGLRFSTRQTARLGNGGGSAQAAGADPAGDEPAATVQLPGEITADLRRLAFDADQLVDDYRKCYGYAEQVR